MCNVFYIDILGLIVFSGELWSVSLCGQTRLRDEKKLFHAKFADHTLSEAGKLSFKERDVSYFFVFPTLSNSVFVFSYSIATYRTNQTTIKCQH